MARDIRLVNGRFHVPGITRSCCSVTAAAARKRAGGSTPHPYGLWIRRRPNEMCGIGCRPSVTGGLACRVRRGWRRGGGRCELRVMRQR
jgi:hypothetical protein